MSISYCSSGGDETEIHKRNCQTWTGEFKDSGHFHAKALNIDRLLCFQITQPAVLWLGLFKPLWCSHYMTDRHLGVAHYTIWTQVVSKPCFVNKMLTLRQIRRTLFENSTILCGVALKWQFKLLLWWMLTAWRIWPLKNILHRVTSWRADVRNKISRMKHSQQGGYVSLNVSISIVKPMPLFSMVIHKWKLL